MFFEWDGMRFKNIDGKWICLEWAMKGPTGSMKDKEVPEPWQSQIEKAWQDKLARDSVRLIREQEGSRSGLNPRKTRIKSKETTKAKKKRRVVKKPAQKPFRKKKFVGSGLSLFREKK